MVKQKTLSNQPSFVISVISLPDQFQTYVIDQCKKSKGVKFQKEPYMAKILTMVLSLLQDIH